MVARPFDVTVQAMRGQGCYRSSIERQLFLEGRGHWSCLDLHRSVMRVTQPVNPRALLALMAAGKYPDFSIMLKTLSKDLPISLSVGLPLFVFIGPSVLALLAPNEEFVAIWIHSELGLVENLTTIFALLGLIVALVGARRSARLSNRLLTAWLVLFAFGFLYIATEEASWGQHWIAWQTPDWLSQINRYGEANLHNVSHGVDRIPKSIVGILLVLGGLGWPIFRRWRKIELGDRFDWRRWLLPADGTLLLAVLFLLAFLVDRIMVWSDLDRPGGDGFSHQEHRELLMVTFLFLYTLSIELRLRRLPAGYASGKSSIEAERGEPAGLHARATHDLHVTAPELDVKDAERRQR